MMPQKSRTRENHVAGQMEESSSGEDRLLTIREVSQLTGLAVGSLYHLASEGRIPTTVNAVSGSGGPPCFAGGMS
jgi:hypothetical protein